MFNGDPLDNVNDAEEVSDTEQAEPYESDLPIENLPPAAPPTSGRSGAAASGSGLSLAVLSSSAIVVDPEVAKSNALLHTQVNNAKRFILEREDLSDMATATAEPSESIRALCQIDTTLAALQKHGKHQTGLSIWQIDALSNPLKGAPVLQHKLRWLIQHYYSQPFDDLSYTLTLGLTQGMTPASAFGSLILVSPPELLLAPILGFAEMVRDKGLTQEERSKCRNALLTASVCIKWYPNAQDLLFDAHNNRRDFSSIGSIAPRTTLQRIFDILQGAEMLTAPNARSVFEYWKLKVKDEPDQEELKLGYIDAVFTVSNSLFKN